MLWISYVLFGQPIYKVQFLSAEPRLRAPEQSKELQKPEHLTLFITPLNLSFYEIMKLVTQSALFISKDFGVPSSYDFLDETWKGKSMVAFTTLRQSGTKGNTLSQTLTLAIARYLCPYLHDRDSH